MTNTAQMFEFFQCPRCQNIMSLNDKVCSKCGIDIEDLKGNCAKCGSVYLLGKRFCSKCNAPLIDESMGMEFNDVGIIYFNLRDSEYLFRAEAYFNNSNYVDSFKELQREENLAQIVKLYKKDTNWIRECLLRVTEENKSSINQVIKLSERIFNEEESKKLQIEILENLLKNAKDKDYTISQIKCYRDLYRLTKKDDYKKKFKDLYYKRKEKNRKFLFFAILKLIIFGFISACLLDLLFIILFGYNFPLKYSSVSLSAVTGLQTWRFIPLFFFIGVSISTSYWLAFNRYFSGKNRKKFQASLVMISILSFLAGACWREIANEREGDTFVIFIFIILLFVIVQIIGIEDIFDSGWEKRIWPILTLFLLYLAIIPGKMAMPIYSQSIQVDFVGIAFFTFSFILFQAIFLILVNRNIRSCFIQYATRFKP